MTHSFNSFWEKAAEKGSAAEAGKVPEDIRDEARAIADQISYCMPDPAGDRSMIEDALMAERKAERERCNAIMRAAWGKHVSLDALEAIASRTWQPIETAPLDGTLVDLWAVRGECGTLGFRDGERYADCRFARNHFGTEPYGERVWQGLNDRYVKVTPTHWMPIPSAPKSEA